MAVIRVIEQRTVVLGVNGPEGEVSTDWTYSLVINGGVQTLRDGVPCGRNPACLAHSGESVRCKGCGRVAGRNASLHSLVSVPEDIESKQKDEDHHGDMQGST